jgi:very-short-patch-repair endonuclease
MRPHLGPDHAIAAIAEAQGGTIDRRQLLTLGLSARAIGRRVGAGSLHERHRGVYAVGHGLLGADGKRWAAVLACGPGAMISHASAAEAWDIRPSAAAVIHVTVPNRSGHRRPGIRVHRPRELRADETTTLHGLPITTPARTLLDLAGAGLRGRRLEAALDRAELRCHVDWAEVARLLERYPRRRGAPALRTTLDRYAPGSLETASVLEEIVLEICDELAVPRPQVNRVIEGRRRDFYWPRWGLVVEADSYTWHRSPTALDEDRERDVELTLAGLDTLRFTYAQCTKRRNYVKNSIRRALGPS